MKKRTLVCFGLLALLVALGLADQVVPVAVSPGKTKGVAVVSELRPTFSWTSVDWAVGYRIEVFEALGVAAVSYEQMASSGMMPVLTKEIEGRGLSWTPSSEEGLPTGGMYVWYVEAMSSSGPGVWSAGKVFIVDEGTIGIGTEERVTRVLREKGVREEVIMDVVKEMKSSRTGVIAGDIGSNPQGDVRTMGTEGSNNTFYGMDAGQAITSGVHNTFIGRSAGYSNTSGYENTFIGQYAGFSNTAGLYNTFVGSQTGRNTEASNNVFIGYIVGYSNTSGYSNSFLGSLAGYSNTAGYNNIFIGNYAGYFNTTGHENTFLGTIAGYNNSAGNNNSFLGYKAGYSNTTGNENTFLGDHAGYSNTTGYANTFFGYYSGNSNTTAGENTFLGYCSGYTNTTGGENTFLGYYSGFANTSGNENTFLGDHAGYSNTIGYNNTFFGYYSGYYNTVGHDNVFLGFSAGYNETGSNKLYIDNSSTTTPLIYGEFDNDIVTINGKFAVGTKTPTYPMELKTTGRNATFILQRSDGGALNFINATSAYGQFGTGNNYPVRIQVNNAWRMSLNTDNSLTMANGATCTAGGVWTNASSRELKENIEGLSAEEAQAALSELAPVKYTYKADKAEKHVGFIAEDVPTLVASKDRKSLSPMDVVGVLTKVVQEQDKKAKEQQKAILEQLKTTAEQQKTLSEYQQILTEQQKTIAELKDRMVELERKGKNQK